MFTIPVARSRSPPDSEGQPCLASYQARQWCSIDPSRRQATSSTDDIYNIAVIRDCVNARVRANLKRVRGRILQIYRVASVSHPMMVHFCDATVHSRCDAEDVDTKRSCEITGSCTKGCLYKLFSAFVSQIYSPAFSEKVSHDSPVGPLVILSALGALEQFR